MRLSTPGLGIMLLLQPGCIEAHPAWQGSTDSGTSATSTGSTGGVTGGSSGGLTDSGSSMSSTGSTTSTGSGSSGSGSGSTGGSTGGAVDGCRPLWAAGDFVVEPPAELTNLNDVNFDGDPALGPDGLTLYFSSARTGGVGATDVWRATRLDGESPFGQPELVPDVNADTTDLGFSISSDGLHVFSVGDGAASIDLRTASRASVGDPFGPWSFLDELNTGDAEYDAFTAGDPLRIYWTVESLPMSKDNLYTATRPASDQPFGTPVLLDVDDPDADDDSPTLTDDELVIVFSSNRVGSLGDQDLWYATRPSMGDPFSTPVLVPQVNAESREGESWISPDGCELFFVSDRPGATGGWDLYRTTIAAP